MKKKLLLCVSKDHDKTWINCTYMRLDFNTDLHRLGAAAAIESSHTHVVSMCGMSLPPNNIHGWHLR